MTVPSAARRYAAVAGWVLTILSGVFLVVVARRRQAEIAAMSLGPSDWLRLGALAVAYGASLFLLAGAWHFLLRSLDAAPEDPRVSIRSFTTSQVAKYVPGNVFHYVGRHMILRKESLPHGRLILASTLEIVLMLFGAGLLVLLMAATARLAGPGRLPSLDWWDALFALAVVALGVVAAVLVRRADGVTTTWLLSALGSYVLFFAVMGAIFNGVVHIAGGDTGLLTAGSGVAGWMAGFVTPGAPAGIGTREAATIVFGSGVLPAEVLLVAAALFRVVTLAGDVLCFAAGHLIPVRRPVAG